MSDEYRSGDRVRCPKCGHVQDGRKWLVEDAARGAVGSRSGAGRVFERCGACDCVFAVAVRVEITLVSPPREGGEG